MSIPEPGTVKPREVIYRGERGKPIAGLGGYQMFNSLAVEANGNVCVATLVSGCISVIAPDGTLVEQVPTGDRVTTNIAFGGEGLKTAYITLSGKGELVAMEWATAGLAAELFEQVMALRPHVVCASCHSEWCEVVSQRWHNWRALPGNTSIAIAH